MSIFEYFKLHRQKNAVLLHLISKWNFAKGFSVHTAAVTAVTCSIISSITFLTGAGVMLSLETTLTSRFHVGLGLIFVAAITGTIAWFYYWRFLDFCNIVKAVMQNLEPSAFSWEVEEFRTEAVAKMNSYLKRFSDDIRREVGSDRKSHKVRKAWEKFAELHLDLYELLGVRNLSHFQWDGED